MNLQTVKTTLLSGTALDWAVAKAEERLGRFSPENYFNVVRIGRQCFTRDDNGERVEHAPSEDWAQGGPITEREKISVVYRAGGYWLAYTDDDAEFQAVGPTPLVAAMRCYVASKLGNEVEIPEELWQPA